MYNKSLSHCFTIYFMLRNTQKKMRADIDKCHNLFSVLFLNFKRPQPYWTYLLSMRISNLDLKDTWWCLYKFPGYRGVVLVSQTNPYSYQNVFLSFQKIGSLISWEWNEKRGCICESQRNVFSNGLQILIHMQWTPQIHLYPLSNGQRFVCVLSITEELLSRELIFTCSPY